MKTAVSLTWISSLILTLAVTPDGLAQNAAAHLPTAAPTASSTLAAASLSPASTGIVKLSAAGVAESTLLAFIAGSGEFDLNAEQITHLTALGVSAPIIVTMIQHDQQLTSRPQPEPAANDFTTAATSALLALAVADSTRTTNAPETFVPETELATSDLAPAEIPSFPDAQGELTSLPATDPAISAPQETPVLYPVREPHPVELTAPIIFVRAPEFVPNTFVIVGFPPTTP